jgi:hypothetical protein
VRKLSVTIILGVILSGIAAIFWFQEGRYLLPTPLPKNYVPVAPAQLVSLDSTMLPSPITKPSLFHFFNPDCPCSRFNLKHFLYLSNNYKTQVDFYAVVTDEEKAEAAKKMLDESVVILIDTNEKLAKACGVYSTPQAAILQKDKTLFFRGNYNRARYCTDKNSNFVQMALDSLMASKAPPRFNELATNSYGCELSEKQSFLLVP